jgi:hypothetical protein
VSGTRIIRTQLIEGIATPAIIHNASYFFVNLQVYGDGLVNCWEMVDFPLFEKKLASGWVTTKIPDGASISIHDFAAWKIEDGSWELTPELLFDRVKSLVRELNPRMENLFDCHGTTVEVIGNVRYARHGIGHERPVKFAKPELGRFSHRTEGEHASIVVRVDDAHYLADLRVFADGTIELGRLPSPETLDLASFAAAAREGRVRTQVSTGTRITIHGLGAFTVVEDLYATDLDELLRGLPDLVDRANGRADSVQRCRDAFRVYRSDPTDERREALRVAYEAVPEHHQMYVGDMDTKDMEVRRILYGETDDLTDDE